jgi:hypothetical protein
MRKKSNLIKQDLGQISAFGSGDFAVSNRPFPKNGRIAETVNFNHHSDRVGYPSAGDNMGYEAPKQMQV